MAQDPNALGAPAEGFGQTVSFAFDPRGEVPMQRPITSSGPRVGATNVSQAQRIADAPPAQLPPPDPTAAVLMKAGQDILQKNLDQARSEEYVKGMQRAMQGEALDDIKESVPWYSKLFGNAPVVAGAQAYTAQDRVNSALSQQAASIKSIEGLGPDDAAKHFVGVINSALTGDAAVDNVVMKQMTEQMPTLLKAQAKAHYAFGQRRAVDAMSKSIASGAGLVQSLGEQYARDEITDKDMDAQGKAFVASALPPAGIDEENYQKTLTSTMLGMAQAGQFHALEALRKSGVTSALTADQARRVEGTIETQATRARDRYAFQFSDTISEIKSDAARPPTGATPRDIAERIDRANSAFQKLTGSPVGLFNSDQKADMLAGTFNAFKAEEDKAANRAAVLADKNATASAKAAAAAEQQAMIEKYVANGDMEYLKMVKGVTNDDIDAEVYRQYKGNPQAGNKFLLQGWAKGYTNQLLANEIQAPVKMAYSLPAGSAPPDGWFKGVDQYEQLLKTGGLGLAQAYFGDTAKSMAYSSYMLRRSGENQAGLVFQRSQQAKDFQGEKLNIKEQAALVSKVASEGKSWVNKATFGFAGEALRDDTARMMAEDVTEGTAQWMATGLSKDEATAAAINDNMTGKSPRAETLGGYYIRRDPLAGQSTISELMQGGNGKPFTAVPEEIRGDIFKGFLADKVKLPDTSGTTSFTRMPDVAGAAQFVVASTDKDGKTSIRAFNSDDLQKYAADKTKWKRLGSSGSNRALTPEEIAAYNEDNKRRLATPYTPVNLKWGPPGIVYNGPGIYSGQGPSNSPQSTAAREPDYAAAAAKANELLKQQYKGINPKP